MESALDLVGRWDSLAQSSQFERLAQELQTWQTSALSGLEAFLAHQDAGGELDEVAEQLKALPSEFPAQFFQDPRWAMHKARVKTLQARLAEGRQNFLLAVGPTPQPSMNAIMLQLALVQENPEWTAAAGDSIFSEIKNLERWGQSLQSIQPQGLRNLLDTLERVAFAMLSCPDAGALRDEVWAAWENFTGAFHAGSAASQLGGPTRSPRWNSWILLLASVEAKEQEPELLLHSLDELDRDIHELEALGGSDNLTGCLQDYFDASGQLREILESGRRVKGWSLILPPLLEEIDHLLTSPVEVEQLVDGSSPLRQLCLRFEESLVTLDALRQGLRDLGKMLEDAKRKAKVGKAPDASESEFLRAIARIEEGLAALRLIQSPGQGLQIEAGYGLVHEGLEQLRQLRTGSGETS